MAEGDDKATRTGRFAWFGTVKGGVAFVGSVLGIVVAIFAIQKALAERRGTPSFNGAVVAPETSRELIDFLSDHDGETVNLDIECVPFGPTVRGTASCAHLDPRLAPFTGSGPGERTTLEVFAQTPCPEASDRCPGTHWLTFIVPPGADEQVNNGRFGAGALVAKGKFKVLVRGGLGTSPAEVSNIELQATD